MKRFILFTGIMLSAQAMAALVPEPLFSMSCRTDIEKVLKKHQSKDRWVRTIDPQKGVFSFRTPTKEIGKWIELQTFPDPYVFFFESKSTKVYQWSGKDCVLLNDTTNRPLEFLVGKKKGFTDAALKTYVEADVPAMIYIWSPSMVYSMSEMKVFRKVAESLEMKFVPLLDFGENAENAKKLISGYEPNLEIKKVQSVELYMREGTTHFPSTYIAGYGRISNRIFGVMTPELLTEAASEELAFIKRVDK